MSGPVLTGILGVIGGMIAVMTVLWVVQCRTRNAGWVDVGWAAGLAAAATFYANWFDGDPTRRALMGFLGTLWGARLALHLARRVAAEPEDGRYRRMREYWAGTADRNFLWFFLAQALLVALFSLPFLVCARADTALAPGWQVAAIVVWLTAVGGESIADWQLARFRANPANRGRTCRQGLWRTSRHPNYFFEWLHWWSYVLLAIGAPGAWLTLLGPVLMFAFLYRVTGIPYTEQQALASRGDDYRDYQRTTSAFFPWFPKGDAK